MRAPKMEFIAPLRCKPCRPMLRRLSKLTAGQPLLLMREPGNPYDGNAITVHDILAERLGYVGREVAVKVAPLMDRGWSFCAVIKRELGAGVDRTGRPIWPIIRIWMDGKDEPYTEIRTSKTRVKRKVLYPIFIDTEDQGDLMR